MHQNRASTAVILVAALLITAVWATASGPGPVPRVLRYHGHLELAGQPVTGVVAMTFHLVDDTATSTLTWEETHNAVEVAAGAFAVTLGEDVTIPAEAFVAAELYLSIDVDGVPLGGLQRLYPVAAAVRAQSARNFSVEGLLDVNGAVDVTGPVGITGDTTMTGTLDVTGAVTGLTATLTACEDIVDNYEQAGGNQEGQLRYLDRMNNLSCPANKVLTDWNVVSQAPNSYRMSFTCCAMSVQ